MSITKFGIPLYVPIIFKKKKEKFGISLYVPIIFKKERKKKQKKKTHMEKEGRAKP